MRELTLRKVPARLLKKLNEASRKAGKSVNAFVLDVLSEALARDDRRLNIRSYIGWSKQEAREFNESLKAQRQIDGSWD